MSKQDNKQKKENVWELAKRVKNKPKKDNKETTTQTQTFENDWLIEMTNILNQNKGLSLTTPSKQEKGAKKQLFRAITIATLENCGKNPNQINDVLVKGNYESLF